MSIAVVNPIVVVEPTVFVAVAAASSDVVIEGVVSHVDRRGKSLYTFEGTGLRKLGRGDVARVTVEGITYRGELVAIAPRRAILHISASRADHGITRQ
jgi:hypothetical protein